MLFFVVIIIDFSYLRKIIKIYNGATEGLVQHTFCEIANYVVNSRLSFARNLVVTENTRLRSSQPRKAWERQAVKKPLFSNIIFKFHDATIQIKPFKKALFLGY